MPGIFICYRRDDTGGYARHLFDRLARQFGRQQIFMDVDTIPVGEDFVHIIDQRIRGCGVMLVLIGKNWLTLADRAGRRRVDEAADFVRLEIEAALAQKITIIPVLVGGARMPAAPDLPGSIARLAYLNSFEIYDRMFEESVNGLISTLRPLVKAPPWQHWSNVGLAVLNAWDSLRGLRWRKERKLLVPLTVAGLVLLLFLIFVLPATLNRQAPASTQDGPPRVATQAPTPQAQSTPAAPVGLDAGAPQAAAIELKTPSAFPHFRRLSMLPGMFLTTSGLSRMHQGPAIPGFSGKQKSRPWASSSG